jgi:hypothetical protein
MLSASVGIGWRSAVSTRETACEEIYNVEVLEPERQHLSEGYSPLFPLRSPESIWPEHLKKVKGVISRNEDVDLRRGLKFRIKV